MRLPLPKLLVAQTALNRLRESMVATAGLHSLWLEQCVGAMGVMIPHGIACSACGEPTVRVGMTYLHPGSPLLLAFEKLYHIHPDGTVTRKQDLRALWLLDRRPFGHDLAVVLAAVVHEQDWNCVRYWILECKVGPVYWQVPLPWWVMFWRVPAGQRPPRPQRRLR